MRLEKVLKKKIDNKHSIWIINTLGNIRILIFIPFLRSTQGTFSLSIDQFNLFYYES